MGSSDGRQDAASPHAAAASSPLTAEDAERFASVLKPMWELDSAPQAAAPVAIGLPVVRGANGATGATGANGATGSGSPSSRPHLAAPALSVKTRQMHGTAVNGTQRYPAIIAPAPSRDSSHEFDDLAQLPRGPSAAPEAIAANLATEPAPPEPLNAFAVEAHLPPRRQQISEPRASVEVDAPPQTVPTPHAGAASSSASFGADAGVAQASFGPTPEQLRARAARVQPTIVTHKDDIAGFSSRRSRAPLFVGLGALVLAAAGAGVFLLNGRGAASAPLAATATSVASPANAQASVGAGTPGSTLAMPIPAPVPVDLPDPADPAMAAADSPPAATAATAPVTAATAPAPTASHVAVRPVAAAITATTPATKGATGKAAPRPAHKAPSAIVRSSPF